MTHSVNKQITREAGKLDFIRDRDILLTIESQVRLFESLKTVRELKKGIRVFNESLYRCLDRLAKRLWLYTRSICQF